MVEPAGQIGRRVLVAALGAALLGGCTTTPPDAAPEVATDDGGWHGTRPDQPYRLPPVVLQDTDGADFRLDREPDADVTMVFFGYTNCPDICGMVMASVAKAVVGLTDEQRERVRVVFVTTDPARDDAQTIRAYLDRFDPDFIGLTGEMDPILRLGESLHVYVSKGKKLPDGGYEVDHSTPVLGLDADHRGVIVWSQDTSPAELTADVQRMLDG